MKRIILTLVLSSLSFGAHAALVDRGGGFIYDDVLDITWTQDATLSGTGTWASQMSWASNLSLYDSVRDVTWDDWRLARVSDDLYGPDVEECGNPSTTEIACRDNELGHLYEYSGVHASVGYSGLFINLDYDLPVYWSGNLHSYGQVAYWFDMNGAHLDYAFGYAADYYGWAVRDGDIASVVPIPAAVYLFASGLGLLGWFRRKS